MPHRELRKDMRTLIAWVSHEMIRTPEGHSQRPLAEIATHIGQLKGDEANAYLSDASYDRLKLRLENALSAVEAATIEARRRVRLNEG
jgi:hypothetical protein